MHTINSLNLYININIWISKIEGKTLHCCVEFSHKFGFIQKLHCDCAVERNS